MKTLRREASPCPGADRKLHLLHIFPSFGVGGSQIRFGQLVRYYGERYRHTVVALNGDHSMMAGLDSAAALEVLDYPSGKRPLLSALFGALSTLDRTRPDRLITYNWGSMDWWLASRFRRFIPHIHLEDGFGPEERKAQYRRRILGRRLLLNNLTTVTVLPSLTLLNIARADWSLPSERVCYIPNGIDWQRFASVRAKRGAEKVVVGTVATLRPEKNIARLIHLFNEAAGRTNVPLKLLIVGGGPELQTLKDLASRTPFAADIAFTGPTPLPEDHLATMDIFGLTSDTEQMPLSILEAMASSLPIVAFSVGDVEQMVSSQNKGAASISPNDDQRFISCLLSFVQDPGLRKAVGDSNRLAVKEHFDMTQMAQRYAALFDHGQPRSV